MPQLRIDDRTVEVVQGTTLLEAAMSLGIHIPTLCHRDGLEPFSSCMVCVVEDVATGRLVPSCAALAAEGMEIRTGTEEVIDARKTAVELLLGEHVGDCEGPCRLACPAHMDIPEMIRHISAGRFEKAIVTVKRDIALPGILGHICPAPCEKACRRSQADGAVAICLLKRFAAEADHESQAPYSPEVKPSSGKSVAIIGAGPAGLAAAWHLSVDGHACTIFDERDKPGGALRYSVDRARLPEDVLDREVEAVGGLGALFAMNTRVGDAVSMDELVGKFDAVIVAAGEQRAEDLSAFGAAISKRGIAAERGTFATDLPGVFAAGAVVAPTRMAVSSLAAGKGAAYSVGALLRSGAPRKAPERFNSRMGALAEGEIAAFMKDADGSVRAEPAAANEGFTPGQARAEAARCLHCDCRKAETCVLRLRAEQYQADARRYRGIERASFIALRRDSEVVYEQGKCIRCGVCVRITRREAEPLGLTFIGRGFDVRVGVPFDESLSEGLRKTASLCVEACPTGALAFLTEEDGN